MSKIVPLGLKNLFLCLFFLSGSFVCFAQNPTSKSEFWNRVRFGGGIGLGFTNGGFNGSIAPSAIYQFNDQFAAGLGLNFNYAKFNESKFLAYGANAMTFYNPIQQLQLSAEFEQLRVNRSSEIIGGGTLEDDYWAPALFLGIGYTSQFATVGIRYDVLYDSGRSIYANAWMPFVRVFF